MKSQFMKFHRSKRNKLNSLCHKLLNSAENINNQGKSLLFHWNNHLQKKKLHFFYNIFSFTLKISNFLNTAQRKRLRYSLIKIISFHKNSRNSAILLKNLIYKKLRSYFSIFRIKQATHKAENRYSFFWRISLLLEKILRNRKTQYFQNFKRKILKNWGFRFKTASILFENYTVKLKYYAFKRLQENNMRKSLKKQDSTQKLLKLLRISKNFMLKMKFQSFLKIKFNNFKTNIKKIIRIYHQKSRNCLRNSFFKWRGNVIVKKIAKKNLTNKVKGKILLSFSRNESNLTIKSSFIRWKVRANKALLRNTMDR